MINAIGPRWARALFVSAESFDADFAEKIGLIQYAVDDESAMEATVEHITKLAFAAAPGAIADAKELVQDVAGREIDHGVSKMTAKRIAHRRMSAEGKEGLSAFLEKRKPSWTK